MRNMYNSCTMKNEYSRSSAKEKRLIYKTRWEGSFGQTIADNSIHRVNNEGIYDHGMGAIAQGARHFGKLGNDAVAFVTGKEKRPAYAGIYGQTRSDIVETLSTVPRLFTEKNRLGTLANGVTSLFDVVYDGLITDPLTIAAGDHANTPNHVQGFTREQIEKTMNN